jgi:hypothetical protein
VDFDVKTAMRWQLRGIQPAQIDKQNFSRKAKYSISSG